jgi:hypothetical protein
MLRLTFIVAILAFFWSFPSTANASQICYNVQTGVQHVPAVRRYDGSIAMQGYYRTIYKTECVWKYGALAVDPKTRKVFSAWNFDDVDGPEKDVVGRCGKQCTWVSFGEDRAWIAFSDDDKIGRSSVISSEDAENKCRDAGGVNCVTVAEGSSTAESKYLYFGAIAYDPTSGQRGAVWQHLRRGEAENAAKQRCSAPSCSIHSFQSNYSSMAMSEAGTLYTQWSNVSEEDAAQLAVNRCKREKGKKCLTVQIGSSYRAATLDPKVANKRRSSIFGVLKTLDKALNGN